ncbi:MAG: sarcosine oxidase subunit alpha family protein [Burkholderiales bacterium]
MTQPFRLAAGGLVDRTHSQRFMFDGAPYEGFAGDTLASALIANGVHLVGRSFKYHRPRGIFSAGAEEPSALVQLARGARTEPNVRATTVELHDGLVATSQNCWPSVRFDVGAVNDLLSRFIPAGFYYKTFMWPPSPAWWLRYEHWIRRAAGMGRAASAPDPDRYDHRYAHCDVLVVGGGLAGLAAARAAASTGARVVVCDENPRWGGGVVGDDATIDGLPAARWTSDAVDALSALADVTLLPRTTAFGYYDGNLVGAVERVTDHLAAPPPHAPRQRLWLIRAKAVVLASGAHERGVAYANNDLPGSMLSHAAHTYVARYGVKPGTRAVVFANHDGAYADALALHAAGVDIAAIVDARNDATQGGASVARAREAGLTLVAGAVVARAHGRRHVVAVDVVTKDGGARRRIDCDLVCVSGGFNPAVHLFSQARGKLRYDDALAAFVPDASPLPIVPAGAVNGRFGVAAALADAHAAAGTALRHAGVRAPIASAAALATEPAIARPPSAPLWAVEAPSGHKRFVDLQNDVTVDDIALARREGYQAVEHLKRYTTLGMGTDQGKTSNVIGLALMAQQLGVAIPQVGTTTFRPPYTPVSLGALPGAECGPHVEPTRRSAMHDWHAAHGARFVNAGLWKRPHSYPRAGESEDEAAAREAVNVRANVGVVDVSTLGKIELQGRDAATFLDRVYCNRFGSLAVGRCRYGVMLRDDGMVLDDGTTSRLAASHYLMTTTTLNAVRVMQHVDHLLQVVWPELEVYATSVTEQWSAAAISGPKARDVVAALVDIDVSNAAFPFLAVGACRVRTRDGDVPARLFRMSYSGELAYELHVAADRGLAMWEAIVAAGAPFALEPYGTEAMSTLRIEKGHVVVGAEADGRTTADDLGLGKLVNAGKWCVGKPLLARTALVAPDRWQLVGLTALDGAPMPRGGKLVADPGHAPPNPMLGHVTSWCYSPHRKAWIALALLANGRARHGERLWVVSPLAGATVRVEVGAPCFIDPDGTRLRA